MFETLPNMHIFASIVILTLLHTCQTNSHIPAPNVTNHEAVSTEEEVAFHDLMKTIFKPSLNQLNLVSAFNRINQMKNNSTKKLDKEKNDVNSLILVENLVKTLTAIGKLKLRTLTLNLKRILSKNDKRNIKIKRQGNFIDSTEPEPEISRSLGNDNTNKFGIWEKGAVSNQNGNIELKTPKLDNSYDIRQENINMKPIIEENADIDGIKQKNMKIESKKPKINEDDNQKKKDDKAKSYTVWDAIVNFNRKQQKMANQAENVQKSIDLRHNTGGRVQWDEEYDFNPKIQKTANIKDKELDKQSKIHGYPKWSDDTNFNSKIQETAYQAGNLQINLDIQSKVYASRDNVTYFHTKIQNISNLHGKPQANSNIQPNIQNYTDSANKDDKSRKSSDDQTKMQGYVNWDDDINLNPKMENKPNINDISSDDQPKIHSNWDGDPILNLKIQKIGNKDTNKQLQIKKYANKDDTIKHDSIKAGHKMQKKYDIKSTKLNYIKVDSNLKDHADWNEKEGDWKNDDSENVELDDVWLSRKHENINVKSNVQENANLAKRNNIKSNIKIDKINRQFEEKMEDLKVKVVKVYLRSVDSKSLALHVLDIYIDLLTTTRQNILDVFENYYSAGDEAMRRHWSYMQDKIISEGEEEKARLVKHLCDQNVVCKLYPAFSDHLADFMDEIMYLPDENIHLIFKALFHQPQEIDFFIKLFLPHYGKDTTTKILSLENDLSKSKYVLQVMILFVSNKFKVFSTENKVLNAKVKALRIIMDIIDQTFKDQSIELTFSDLKIGLQNWIVNPTHDKLVKSLNMFMKRFRIILTTELNDMTKRNIKVLSAFVLSGEVNDVLYQLLENL